MARRTPNKKPLVGTVEYHCSVFYTDVLQISAVGTEDTLLFKIRGGSSGDVLLTAEQVKHLRDQLTRFLVALPGSVGGARPSIEGAL